jgi:sugar/nucleoside kinase (ribokinase family)
MEGYLAFYGETLETSLSFAKDVRATTSFDLASAGVVGMFMDKFHKNVPKMDVVFGNLEEMTVYTGIKEFKNATECFREKQTIIATDGKNGCWVKNRNETEALHYDVEPVLDVVDTTGAGDIFAGGYLSAMLRGDDVRRCVKKAHLAASYVIQSIGADMPDEKWDALKIQTSKV